jgi:hypothetical protein
MIAQVINTDVSYPPPPPPVYLPGRTSSFEIEASDNHDAPSINPAFGLLRNVLPFKQNYCHTQKCGRTLLKGRRI